MCFSVLQLPRGNRVYAAADCKDRVCFADYSLRFSGKSQKIRKSRCQPRAACHNRKLSLSHQPPCYSPELFFGLRVENGDGMFYLVVLIPVYLNDLHRHIALLCYNFGNIRFFSRFKRILVKNAFLQQAPSDVLISAFSNPVHCWKGGKEREHRPAACIQHCRQFTADISTQSRICFLKQMWYSGFQRRGRDVIYNSVCVLRRDMP